jgi:peptidoglycan lytic transglycosylase
VLVPAAPAAGQTSGGAEAPPVVQTGGVLSAEGPVAISARSGSMLGRVARFRGTVAATEAGQTITVERFDELAQTWSPLATTTVAADGSYDARWKADRIGQHRVRAVLVRPGAATAAAASAELTVTVHRSATATWYGPGFYGRRTACGLRMTRTLIGVAHRRLPCGTQVALLYRGRTLTVPVVDRGPFRRGTTWDLTAAAAQALDFRFTDRVGAVPLAPALPIG